MKYSVRIKEVHAQVIEVEADSPAHARQIAEQVVDTGKMPDGSDLYNDVTYCMTLDPSMWTVWTGDAPVCTDLE